MRPSRSGRSSAEADQEGREAHDQDRDEEGVFPADEIADAAEEDGAEGAHQEAGREGQEAKTLRVVTSNAEKNCAPMIVAREP